MTVEKRILPLQVGPSFRAILKFVPFCRLFLPLLLPGHLHDFLPLVYLNLMSSFRITVTPLLDYRCYPEKTVGKLADDHPMDSATEYLSAETSILYSPTVQAFPSLPFCHVTIPSSIFASLALYLLVCFRCRPSDSRRICYHQWSKLCT